MRIVKDFRRRVSSKYYFANYTPYSTSLFNKGTVIQSGVCFLFLFFGPLCCIGIYTYSILRCTICWLFLCTTCTYVRTRLYANEKVQIHLSFAPLQASLSKLANTIPSTSTLRHTISPPISPGSLFYPYDSIPPPATIAHVYSQQTSQHKGFCGV